MTPDELEALRFDVYLTRKEELFLKDLLKAYIDARKHKRSTDDAHIFEEHGMWNLMLLFIDIIEETYEPSRGIAFITYYPVTREIFAAPFRDRIVHHLLYNASYEWWDKRLIYDSYSCRVSKGTLFGIRRAEKMMRQVTRNFTVTATVAKFDLQGFFMSLKRIKLSERVKWGLDRQFMHKGWRYRKLKFLWYQIIMDDPVRGVYRRGGEAEWKRSGLADSKSLFKQPPGQGIVIGNLSSQLLSNIFLDVFDRFVKYQLKYKHYGRYVDDFFIMVPSTKKDQLLKDVKAMERFLAEMGLTLHPKKRTIQNVDKGFEFLGVVIYPRRTVAGKRFKEHFYDAAQEVMMGIRGTESLVSYLGYLKHIKGKKLAKKIFESVGWEYCL